MVFTLSPQWRELCRRIESQSSNVTGILRDLCEEAVGMLGKPCAQLDNSRHANASQSRKISSTTTKLTY